MCGWKRKPCEMRTCHQCGFTQDIRNTGAFSLMIPVVLYRIDVKEGYRRTSAKKKDFDSCFRQPHRHTGHLMFLKLRCFPRCSLMRSLPFPEASSDIPPPSNEGGTGLTWGELNKRYEDAGGQVLEQKFITSCK